MQFIALQINKRNYPRVNAELCIQLNKKNHQQKQQQQRQQQLSTN